MTGTVAVVGSSVAGARRPGAPHAVTIGDPAAVPTRAAVLYGDTAGRITGAVTVNWPRALVECRRQVAAGSPVAAVAERITAPSRPDPPNRRSRPVTGAPDLDALRSLIADGCRVLAARGLADGILGHISHRVGDDRLLVRCRGPRERGLLHTTPEDVRLVDLDGGPGAPGELDGGWNPPNELPLHTEVLRARPDVDTVVHAHPPAVVTADLAGLAIRPIVGAFDIPGAHLAAGGVPVHPRGVLIRDRRLAAEMVASLGARPVVVLRAHGLTSTGRSVQEAVLRAISVDGIARMSLAVVQAGGRLADLPEEDLRELPDLGGTFNHDTAWRHEIARLGA